MEKKVLPDPAQAQAVVVAAAERCGENRGKVTEN